MRGRLDAARCGQRATKIRNVIRLLRVDTLGALVAVAIGIERIAVRADADGVIAVAFLVLSTVRNRVDASVGELNASGTGKPQVYGVVTADTHGLIVGTTLIRNPICLLRIDTQGTEGTGVTSRDLATDVANANWLVSESSTTLIQSSIIFRVKAVAARKPHLVITGGAVTRDHGKHNPKESFVLTQPERESQVSSVQSLLSLQSISVPTPHNPPSQMSP
jgi:hypothetical protein